MFSKWEKKFQTILLAVLAALLLSAATQAKPLLEQRIEHEGIVVDLEIERVDEKDASTPLREGDDVRVRFQITDTTSQAPMSGLYPAAWMDRILDPDDPLESDEVKACQDKVAGFIGGTLLAQPELDLNVYYVLALNEDASISVVDPLFGFGGSKLLDMVLLKSPGIDWALSQDQRHLYVSMPKVNQVAVVSLATWRVIENLDAGNSPGRLALQGDGRYLWVAYDEPMEGESESGVVVIDTAQQRQVARIPTGGGSHHIALSDDDRHAFITNPASGTVSVIDVHSLAKVHDVATGQGPASIDYSPLAQAAYVSHQDGTLAAVTASSDKPFASMMAEPGLGQIKVAPGGRLALVLNPGEDVVHVIDTARNRIVQTGDMMNEPDQIAYTDELAYIRHRKSSIVLMIPLGELGRDGKPVPIIDFPGGQYAPGDTEHPTFASGIVQAPGATAVLVSNPRDKVIYYYKEGMAAPMGHFRNYRRQPRAVQVIDRSLREISSGTYETTVKLRRPGHYDLAFFLDTPSMIHCFPLDIETNPALLAKNKEEKPSKVEVVQFDNRAKVDEESVLRYRLSDPKSGEPQRQLDDLQAFTMLVPGTWFAHQPAKEIEAGLYEVRFTPPQPGVYYVYLRSSRLGLDIGQGDYLILDARADASADTSPAPQAASPKESRDIAPQ